MDLILTDAAVAHILQMMNKEGGMGFRLSIKKTGCSGYAYVPAIVQTAMASDIHFIVQQGLFVYLDPACAEFVRGTVIDYVQDTAIGLKQKRLVFINPQEKNRCGC